MKTTQTIQNFLNENNPEKLKEFVGLFNPDEPELIKQYDEIFNKLKNSYHLSINAKIENFGKVEINQNLFSTIGCNKNSAFVLHKINSEIKILYQGYDSDYDCSGELHFLANKLFLANYSYPKLLNGSRIQFLNQILGIDISEYFTHEYINIDTSNQNVILIENGAVLKVYYLNKDTLESLHQ